ncbi:MAG: DUF4105 domain-containing protein [Bacteriovoracaceae bacterium]|nr:DUF4105 domain-containing protein [Bacteriovoracaceae bacterium]
MKLLKLIIIQLVLLSASTHVGASQIDTPTDIVMQELFQSQDDIIGIDVHVAGGYEDGPMFSRWGHAFLVFVNKNEKKYYNNIAISLVADLSTVSAKSDSVISMYAKGLYGSYPLTFEADYFYYFWDQYVVGESRPLERITIALNEEIKSSLFENLRKAYEDPKSMGTYKFITNNCIVAVSNLLKSSGIPLEDGPLIPLNAKKYYQKSAISMAPDDVVSSSTKNLSKLVEELQSMEIKTYEQINEELIIYFANKYGAGALLRLISSDRHLYFTYSSLVMKKFAKELEKDSIAKSFKAYTQMYELCETQECAQELIGLEKEIYTEEEFATNSFKRHARVALSSDSNAYIQHNKLLTKVARDDSVELLIGGIKQQRGTLFKFTPGRYDQEEGVLELNILKIKKGTSTRVVSLKAKIPMDKNEHILSLKGRACVDHKTNKFLENCGVIEEDGEFRLYAY